MTDTTTSTLDRACIPPRKHWWGTDVALALAAAMLGFALIPVGAAIFPTLRDLLHRLPARHLFLVADQFANPYCAVLAGIAIWLADRRHRVLVPYLFVGMLMAGAVTTTLKEAAGRARPEWSVALDPKREKQLRAFQTKNPGKHVPVERRDIWLGLDPNKVWMADQFTSFPSGHTTAAFSFAAFLWLIYRRGRFVWLLLAVFAALARVKGAHHYLEDVLVGGAFSWMVAQWVYTWHWPGKVGLWLANRLGGEAPPEARSSSREESSSTAARTPTS